MTQWHCSPSREKSMGWENIKEELLDQPTNSYGVGFRPKESHEYV